MTDDFDNKKDRKDDDQWTKRHSLSADEVIRCV